MVQFSLFLSLLSLVLLCVVTVKVVNFKWIFILITFSKCRKIAVTWFLPKKYSLSLIDWIKQIVEFWVNLLLKDDLQNFFNITFWNKFWILRKCHLIKIQDVRLPYVISNFLSAWISFYRVRTGIAVFCYTRTSGVCNLKIDVCIFCCTVCSSTKFHCFRHRFCRWLFLEIMTLANKMYQITHSLIFLISSWKLQRNNCKGGYF